MRAENYDFARTCIIRDRDLAKGLLNTSASSSQIMVTRQNDTSGHLPDKSRVCNVIRIKLAVRVINTLEIGSTVTVHIIRHSVV